MRLNKYISDSGYCSRREADRLTQEGKVKVNGNTASVGMKVSEDDRVEVNGTILEFYDKKDKVVYAMYKPEGIVSTMADEPDGLLRYLKGMGITRRVYPVGRLDKESCGLLLLTDDGDMMNRILKTSNNHGKEYVVKVNKDITDEFIEKMASGVLITDKSKGDKVATRKCTVIKNGKRTFTIVLMQGLNRQIRRMCGALGYEVVTLKRVRIMNIGLKGLREGEIRRLSEEEYTELKRLCGSGSCGECGSNGGGYGED